MVVTPRTREDLKSALPDTSKTLRLKGLDATVEIYRDKHGIPHVSAQTTNDAFFAQGFVAAQDRLWHMDYDRCRAYGRWAEYAGATTAWNVFKPTWILLSKRDWRRLSSWPGKRNPFGGNRQPGLGRLR